MEVRSYTACSWIRAASRRSAASHARFGSFGGERRSLEADSASLQIIGAGRDPTSAHQVKLSEA
jgi:hypothetical protein